MKRQVICQPAGRWYKTILLVIVTLLMVPALQAVEIIRFPSGQEERIRSLTQLKQVNPATLASFFGLEPGESFSLVSESDGPNGFKHYRYRQEYKGHPLLYHQLVITKNSAGKVMWVHGSLVKGIPADLNAQGPAIQGDTLDKKRAIAFSKDVFTKNKRKKPGMEMKMEMETANCNYQNETSKAGYFIDQSGKARLCYAVSFFVDTPGEEPARPRYIIDAVNWTVVDERDILNHDTATGPGGNTKTGEYYWGTDYPAFNVSSSGGTCYMDTSKVQTWDMNNTTTSGNIHSFACSENTYKPVNDAFCPLNDAHAYGFALYNMYMAYMSEPPVTLPMILWVHYGSNNANAYWDGTKAMFGDGNHLIFPLVSLEVITHEISHGFTDRYSNLENTGESGGIDESFSDMGGAAAENYFRGSYNWKVGNEVFKGSQVLRHMDDPPLDGSSIDHIDDYTTGMAPHYSCGIYNKAFYVLSTTTRWNIKRGFRVFATANKNFWTSTVGFVDGAAGVLDATKTWNYPVEDVRDAFDVVGINLDIGPVPYMEVSYYGSGGGASYLVTDQKLNHNANFIFDEGLGLYEDRVDNTCGHYPRNNPSYVKLRIIPNGINIQRILVLDPWSGVWGDATTEQFTKLTTGQDLVINTDPYQTSNCNPTTETRYQVNTEGFFRIRMIADDGAEYFRQIKLKRISGAVPMDEPSLKVYYTDLTGPQVYEVEDNIIGHIGLFVFDVSLGSYEERPDNGCNNPVKLNPYYVRMQIVPNGHTFYRVEFKDPWSGGWVVGSQTHVNWANNGDIFYYNVDPYQSQNCQLGTDPRYSVNTVGYFRVKLYKTDGSIYFRNIALKRVL